MVESAGATGLLGPFAFARGWQESVIGTAPAAGANFSASNDSRFYSRLIACTFTLVTDANVASRYVSLDYQDGNGLTLARNGVQGAVTASTTARFSFDMHRTVSEANANSDVFAPLVPLFVHAGQLVAITVVGIQVGDQLGTITLTFERFPSDRRDYPSSLRR